MAITVDELVIRIQQQGARQTVQELQSVRQAVGNTTQAARGLADTHLTLMSLAGSLGAAVSALMGLGATLAAITGLQVAAEYRDIALSLEQMTGSADRAQKILKEMRKMGAETPFETADLARFASQLIASGTAAEKVTDELRTLADLGAWARMPRHELPEFLRNLVQIRGREHPELQDLYQLTRTVPGIGKIVGAGLGTGELASTEAIQRLQQMSGKEAYETILKGTEMLARDAAKMAGLLSPLSALGNLIENIRTVMEPTGQILLQILMPVVDVLSRVAQAFGSLNELGKGMPGLVLIIWGLVKVKGVLVNSFVAAVTATRTLTQTLIQYAEAATAASTAASMVPKGSFAPSHLPVPDLKKDAPGGSRGGWLDRVRGWRASMPQIPSGIKGIGAGILLDLGSQEIQKRIPNTGKQSEALKSLVGDMGLYAGIGLGIGGIPGALIGLGVAAVKNLFQYGINPSTQDTAAQQKIARNTEEAARALRTIQGELVGGGTHGRKAVSRIELEIALERMKLGFV